MRKINTDLLIGTTDFLSVAISFVIIVFLILFIKKKGYETAGSIYKDWMLFSGICLLVTSLVFRFIIVPQLENEGFTHADILLLNIYNRFLRMLGLFFLLIWTFVFEFSIIADKIDEWYKRKELNRL